MKRMTAFVIAAITVLMASAASAGPNLPEIQGLRGPVPQIARGEDSQAPRGEHPQAPRG
jgi:hypothetical protein